MKKGNGFSYLCSVGDGRVLLEAAMGSPWISRIITPMLELVPSSEAAPSAFILKKHEGGARQLGAGGERSNGGWA